MHRPEAWPRPTARALGAVLACGLSAACATGAGHATRAAARVSGGHKSYILPVVEIVAMDAAVNLGGRLLLDPADFEVTPASIRRNLRGPWVVDDDPFEINQFGHPYQGAMYHGIARSNGLSYWPSVAYTFAGERALGNRRRNHAALSKRSDCQRHRGLVSGRAALSHLPSPAGAR